jgi:hypothetical protein
MRNRFLAAILVCLTLAGCAATRPQPAPPPGSGFDSIVAPFGGVQVQGGIPAVENAQVARAFLTKGEEYKPFQDNLPFGLVLLKKGDDARNAAVCSAFVNGIPTPEDVLQANPDASIILTYWLLKDPLSGTEELDCKNLLADYDFKRAAKLRNSYGRASATGPIFLGLQLNKDVQTAAGAKVNPYVAILDMSGLSAADAGMMTAQWFDQVATPAEDLAEGPAYAPEDVKKAKGRSWFGKLLHLAKKVAVAFTCDVLKSETKSPTIAQAELQVFDPEYKIAVGAVRVFTQGNKVVGFAANLLAQAFCPSDVAMREEPARSG